MKRFLPLFLIFIVYCSEENDSELANIFRSEQVQGTMLITDLASNKEYIYNRRRSQQRFIPASTFKIANTLIALHEKIIPLDVVFKWNGVKREFLVWNQNQTLQMAFSNSCVWCYQEIASQISAKKYHKHLKHLAYGNKKIGPSITNFWLDDTLKISAAEQVKMLKRIYLKDVPYDDVALGALKRIMQQEKNKNFTLYAKTGYGVATKPKIGWFVGYIESSKRVWFFALNMNVTSAKELKLRKQLVLRALKSKKII